MSEVGDRSRCRGLATDQATCPVFNTSGEFEMTTSVIIKRAFYRL